MAAERILHFAFTPVQGFVSQARRARDLWAGSYLLSYLAARAMLAVQRANGEILIPNVKADPLMEAVRTNRASGLADEIGSVPNRFKARVPEAFNPQDCSRAVRDAWTGIGEKVWTRASLPRESRRIWDRQMMAQWECLWTVADDDRSLVLRKSIRAHEASIESGEKCTLCGERQELSGDVRGSRTSINKWWKDQKSRAQLADLDLRDNERLCAVCLTKRLFPRVAKEAIGWDVPENFPSTAHMCAADWIVRVLAQTPAEAGEFALAARAGKVGLSEKRRRLVGIERALAEATATASAHRHSLGDFVSLDASVFFESELASLTALPEITEQKQRSDLVKRLRKLCKQVGSTPSPFYAILVMDGDGLGRLLGSEVERQQPLTDALADFSHRVPGIVDSHDGRVIYAGGDDVFALVGLDRALACAAALRKAYGQAFSRHVPHIPEHQRTISAAIVYAHLHTALSAAVRDARDLLDDVAKTAAGRDAVACRVWKRGGPVLTWAQPWSKVLDANGSNIVDRVKVHFTGDGSDDGEFSGTFSSKFFYKIRDLFEVLQPGGDAPIEQPFDEKLLVAEYLSTRDTPWPKGLTADERRNRATRRVSELLKLCREERRVVKGDDMTFEPRALRADGALLVRFLAQKEV